MQSLLEAQGSYNPPMTVHITQMAGPTLKGLMAGLWLQFWPGDNYNGPPSASRAPLRLQEAWPRFSHIQNHLQHQQGGRCCSGRMHMPWPSLKAKLRDASESSSMYSAWVIGILIVLHPSWQEFTIFRT